jgi:hypothetical protein
MHENPAFVAADFTPRAYDDKIHCDTSPSPQRGLVPTRMAWYVFPTRLFFPEKDKIKWSELTHLAARVFRSFLEQRLALLWHHITHFYLPKEKKRLALMAWYEAHLPIGVHPFRAEWAYTRRVGGYLLLKIVPDLI